MSIAHNHSQKEIKKVEINLINVCCFIFNFAGLRVFLLSEEFTQKTFLLAVKQYKPAPTMAGENIGELVRVWAEQVLIEFGLDWHVVAGAVTDSVSDVKFAFGNIPGVLREGCISHMLNRATIDGFGMSSSAVKSKNTLARQGIVQVQKVAEHMDKSAYAVSTLCPHP